MTIETRLAPPVAAAVPDPRLASIIASAEAGEACPGVINLLVGSWLIQGRPVSSEIFLQASFDSMCQSVLAVKQPRRSRIPEAERVQRAQEAVAPGFAAVEAPEADADTLCLADVSLAASSGPSLHPPAIRVAASSVMAWWITDFEVREERARGTGVGVGVGVEFVYEV
ncbi:hypothetical protein WCD74_03105 [Actinomycetospora sp. OC33-EN08]|uniref:Uncharacterized protein n=1 Tax=Actinomycetospora aurantiaca TaxID=3129233 RepID=A0ABU8MHD6_9PSEU